MINYRKIIRYSISIAIFTILIVTFLSNFITLNYVVFGNILGYSLFTNIITLYFLVKNKFCYFTKVANICLIIFNILCLLNSFNLINYADYSYYYDISVITIAYSILIIKIITSKSNK